MFARSPAVSFPQADPSWCHGPTSPGPWPAGADPAGDPPALPMDQSLTIPIVMPGLEDGEQGFIQELAEAFPGQPASQPLPLVGHGRQGSAAAVAQARIPALTGPQPGRLPWIQPQGRRLGWAARHPGRQTPQQHTTPQSLPAPLWRQVLQGVPLPRLEPLRAVVPCIQGARPQDQGGTGCRLMVDDRL